MTSITRPVVTAELMGREGFGAISGVFALGFMGAVAAAPSLAAVIWTVGGYDLVRMAVLAGVLCGAATYAGALHLAARRARRVRPGLR